VWHRHFCLCSLLGVSALCGAVSVDVCSAFLEPLAHAAGPSFAAHPSGELQCAAVPDITLTEIAAFIGGSFTGPATAAVRGVAGLKEAGGGDLSFLSNPKYASLLDKTAAAAILVSTSQEGESERWIRVSNPYLAFARVLQRWFSNVAAPLGVSPLASVARSARLGQNAGIGPFVTIADDVVLGSNVRVFQGVSIERGCVIGDDTWIYPNAVLYAGTTVGARCIIHGGAIIGSDGYGFASEGGVHTKIPQIGIVRIEDDVEIGAGTTIDRAALGETVIGQGTKIDNLVQIGHNVRIGRHCLIVAQVGIAGSSELGDHVVLAGQAGVAGHLQIASGVQVEAQSAVLKSVREKTTLAGFPARPAREFYRAQAATRRLPELIERVKRLEAALKIERGAAKKEEAE
jgi:UDP-3-O-[3-hydroxymyristoyl] glucosamine N-acyltransferase